MPIDAKSVASTPLVLYAYSQPVGNGTGFVVRVDNIDLLITNYHVLSGRHPETGAQLPGVAALPDRVLVPLLRIHDPELRWRPVILELERDGSPLWVTHPVLGRRFDVVALPLVVPSDAQTVPYSRDPGPQLAVPPSSDVAIIGFPEGMTAPGLTAIWKGGSVASELDLTVGDGEFFWIDANTRQGMSGSPVVARRFGGALMADGGYGVHTGVVDRVLGVYAGRAFNAPDMTLGRVWKWEGVQSVIDEAVARVRRGTSCPKLYHLAHYAEAGKHMVLIEIQRTPDVPVRLSTGVLETQRISLGNIIRDFVLSDDRFGINLERLKMAAAIDGALEAAVMSGASLELGDAQYALVREVITTPSKPYNAAFARFFLPLLEYVLAAGANARPAV